ncbi:hypothetical protein PLESTB_001583700 [Pleodorina starrii]|uniref:AAA+ ATPase domain-containing protein n=1 Tax=Pleodorina starrii TaxID=330485 RepID=A0A9W6F8G3_9CHLO|nr:hypothetical protein PLESTB_001583700 [Pleodorina starrii]
MLLSLTQADARPGCRVPYVQNLFSRKPPWHAQAAAPLPPPAPAAAGAAKRRGLNAAAATTAVYAPAERKITPVASPGTPDAAPPAKSPAVAGAGAGTAGRSIEVGAKAGPEGEPAMTGNPLMDAVALAVGMAGRLTAAGGAEAFLVCPAQCSVKEEAAAVLEKLAAGGTTVATTVVKAGGVPYGVSAWTTNTGLLQPNPLSTPQGLLQSGALRLRIGPDGRGRVQLPANGAAGPGPGTSWLSQQAAIALPEAGGRCAGASDVGADMGVVCGLQGADMGSEEAAGDPGMDEQLEAFLEALPDRLGREVRKAQQVALSGSGGAGSGGGRRPPLVADIAVDCGRPVRVAFSDGSKMQLQCVVSMDTAIWKLGVFRRLHQEGGQRQQRQQQQQLAAADVASLKRPRGPKEAEQGGSWPSKRRAEAGREEAWTQAEQQQRQVARGGRDGAWMGTGAAAVGCGDIARESPVPEVQAAEGCSARLLFGSDNRYCPPGTLHRVSAMFDPADGSVYGLTYRMGRHVPGVAELLRDVVTDLAGRGRGSSRRGQARGALPGQPHGAGGGGGGGPAVHLSGSLLLVGRPGSGKTTLLRDITRLLADDLGLAVMVVVDTSNEIAGGDVLPHACIGSARRVMVGHRSQLHSRMLEAVQNHGPEVLVVDEIANKLEVDAARTISQRGVMLVATAHGTDLGSLLHNVELNPLVGGTQTVTLGDELAAATNGGSKTRTERRGAPPFRTLVEVMKGGRLRVRPDVASSVDALLVPPGSTSGTSSGGSGVRGRGAAWGGFPAGPRGPRQAHHSGGRNPNGHGQRGQVVAAPPPPPPPQQQPGSLILLPSLCREPEGAVGSCALGSGGSGGLRSCEETEETALLEPLEQLRWTEQEEGRGRGQKALFVRLLRPTDGAPDD